jgi:protein-S-isoprenylcysteine O-methyltransferase Ste14
MTHEKNGFIGAQGKRIIQVVMILFFQSAILFAAAGRLDWLRAWVFVGVQCVLLVVSGVVMIKKNPELIGHRGEIKPDVKRFDKIHAVVSLPLPFIVPAVAGLDFRAGWSDMPPLLAGVGIPLWVWGSLLFLWAMVVNVHFEGGVRIQKDRDHKVCTEGPYKYVRHPGYTGMICMYGGIPLILGSWWTFLPVGVMVVLLIIRTALEDRTLRDELAGYTGYAHYVKYRLLPKVW